MLLRSRIQHISLQFPSAVGGLGDTGQTWVIAGSDSRADDPPGPRIFGTVEQVPGQRADVVLVVHRAAGRTSVLSIPRDLLVSPVAGKIERLTLTLQDGPQSLVDGLCNSLGIAGDHFLSITMAGFADVVDALGGVSVALPHAIRDPSAGLAIMSTGSVHLDGRTALALVRSRNPQQLIDGRWLGSDPDVGAAARTKWAGMVFAALRAKAKGVRNPLRLQALAWTATGAITTDSHTGLDDLRALRSFNGSVIDLPTTSLGATQAVTVSAEGREVLAQAGFGSCHSSVGND